MKNNPLLKNIPDLKQKKRIKVLVVDDSALMRQKLTEILDSDPDIRVISSAGDPYIAVHKMKKEAPDVITLDLQMPRMNGLQFLKIIMEQHPMPVIIISSYTSQGTPEAMKAYEFGAVDVIGKPTNLTGIDFQEFKIRLCGSVKAAHQANIRNLSPVTFSRDQTVNRIGDRETSAISSVNLRKKIIVIGASTGGTVAIEKFLSALPPEMPGIAIAQHMPEGFTNSFAKRLDKICRVHVKEAIDGEIVNPGWAYIAPGHSHLLVKKNENNYYLELRRGPLVNHHRPSVDVLFRSAARYAGKNTIGIIMTGMGSDGARGMLELKNTGAKTIAQDERSCVVFGMPKEAIKLNSIDKVVPLEKIAREVIRILHE